MRAFRKDTGNDNRVDILKQDLPGPAKQKCLVGTGKGTSGPTDIILIFGPVSEQACWD
jgi:hypothetical protein